MDEIVVLIYPDGKTKSLWTDEIDLYELGTCEVERASDVRFNMFSQMWEAVLPTGEVIATDRSRTKAIEMEVAYLQKEM